MKEVYQAGLGGGVAGKKADRPPSGQKRKTTLTIELRLTAGLSDF